MAETTSQTGRPRTKRASSVRRAPNASRTSYLTLHKQHIRYVAGVETGTIFASVSTNGKTWKTFEHPVLLPRSTYFDDTPLGVIPPPVHVPEGILLLYFTRAPLAIGAALFDTQDPTKLVRRSERAFWSSEEELEPLRLEFLPDHAVIVFKTPAGEELKTVVDISSIFETQIVVRSPRERREPQLKRHTQNPIITPHAGHAWESQATFNPAAIHLKGKVHILYRAVGDDGISVVGYAASKDGVTIDERLPHPVFVPESPFDKPVIEPGMERFPSASGGGFGGSEDPRVAVVDDRVYMTYTAFDGRHPPGVALTSVSTDDFLAQQWRWKKPVLISPRGEQHKNWVVFPKKIRGKYAVLHSISPKVSVDYFDTLDFDGSEPIRSMYHAKRPTEERWDDQPRGVGSPPVETPQGWLVLYHAMDSRDPNRYKVGALLLDRDDPTKVLHRSQGPILEPDESYENEGYKSGVVYACGAVVMNDTLYVYYGGADTVTCVASYPLDDFLTALSGKQPLPRHAG